MGEPGLGPTSVKDSQSCYYPFTEVCGEYKGDPASPDTKNMHVCLRVRVSPLSLNLSQPPTRLPASIHLQSELTIDCRRMTAGSLAGGWERPWGTLKIMLKVSALHLKIK